MKVSAMAAALAASTLVVGAAVTGCGSNKSSSPSSTSSSSSTSTSAAPPSSAAPTSSSAGAQPGDYSGLLIKPADIVVANDTFTLLQTVPVPNPAGTEGVFMNQAGSRKIDDTIYIYPDAAAASQALDQSAKAIPDLSVKATPTAAPRSRLTPRKNAPVEYSENFVAYWSMTWRRISGSSSENTWLIAARTSASTTRRQ